MSAHDQGWRYVVRNFTPAWFSVNMGTGIVSILLNTLPYNANWVYWLSVIVFALNVLLFSVFILITVVRYALYPNIFPVMITHPTQSLFLGTLPMGFATIINMVCFVCVPVWGTWAGYCAWAMWIVDAVLSICTCFGIPFIMMTRQSDTDLGSMGAAWLLPIVSCVVAAASGAIVADVLPNPEYALATLVVSFVLWGVGVPLALMVIVIYLQRLMLHHLPPRTVIVSTFLPLGPLGQGGFAIQKLGMVARTIFPQTHTLQPGAGDIFYDMGFVTGLLLWAFGLVWLFFAAGSILQTRKFPFNLGWWALTFPLGVFATSTCQLGREMPSKFFSVLGTTFSLAVVLLWMIVAVSTVKGICDRSLLVAPCLSDLREKQQRQADQQGRQPC